MYAKTLLVGGLGGILLACALPMAAWAAQDGHHRGETTVTCGQVITRSIKLANDLHNCRGNGLEVGASRITIDLNGHTIDGSGGALPFSGIDNTPEGLSRTGHFGVTIKNGTVTDFGGGITLGNGADRNRVQRILATENGGAGISARNVDRPHISESAATENSRFGIFLELVTNARVEHSAALNNGSDGIAVTASRRTVLYRNSAVNNRDDGIDVAASATATRIDDNDANGNGRNGENGINVRATDAATVIRDNRARNNDEFGIRAERGVTDGGGNRASGNGNPAQCLNIICTP
ncbi:right-handed parallel beta-helix repeat-containing protein [Nonomuraea ferruginea]|uniref:Right-handed parallel beta-helix repeat-containing protein n=1 Tax=Nonomuraea ferruginea TaxID=46174 RepID=A0ABT4STL0_9ACTN|nr:right-handed parallel beta-helix repeat-containing protein [Nonomuraea ferruginea]MDA0640507.1 right-handed parallel beta-helix repeat-containing protein [Nonomuraea ferruginea]